MRKLNDIYKLIDSESIILEEVNFENNIEGIYVKIIGLNPIIGVNKNILDSKKYISILAEELGHHFTTVRDLTVECITYSDKLIKSKAEHKARSWAADFLISDNEFIQALNSCISTISEFAEYFNVTEEIIQYKMLHITYNETKYHEILNNFYLNEIQYKSCQI